MDPQPTEGKWTFGAGVGGAQGVPKYIGSGETRNYLLPIPYINYQGPKLSVSQSGITTRLFDSDKWLLSVSLSGALAVDSDATQARQGMPDIDYVFEYGPSLKYFFFGDDFKADALYLDLNFRKSQTIEFKNLDISSSPSLVWRNKLDGEYFGGELRWNQQVRLEFVAESYAEYFYSVPEAFANEQRQAFRAKGGFGGVRASSGLRWAKDKHIVSLFVGFADISQAAYKDSPLIDKKQHLYWGLAWFKLF